MRKVWYVANIIDRMDITSAGSFGKLSPIFTGVTPFEIHLQQKIVCNEVIPNSDENDLLLLAGPSSMTSVLSSLWFQHFGMMKFLLWDFGKGRYVEHFLDANRSPKG